MNTGVAGTQMQVVNTQTQSIEKTWDVYVFDDGSTISTVTNRLTGDVFSFATDATADIGAVSKDGQVDSLVLINFDTGARTNQYSATVATPTATTNDGIAFLVNAARNAVSAADNYLVDAAEMRMFVGAADPGVIWGGARLLEFGEGPLADWYNLAADGPVPSNFDGLNGYLADYGLLNFGNYDGLGLLPGWNQTDTTSFLSYGWGVDGTAPISAPGFDDFYGLNGDFDLPYWDLQVGDDASWDGSYDFWDLSGDFYWPVVLDLDGDGVELIKLQDSKAYFDVLGDGYRRNVSWVGADDALLAIDKNLDGMITLADELSFALWTADPNDSDLAGLKSVFDTNHSGTLDSGDSNFSSMRLWRDLNGDGVSDAGELQSLSQAGISFIDLSPVEVDWTMSGAEISAFTTFKRTNGTVGLAADVGLEHESSGTKLGGTFSGYREVLFESGLKMLLATGSVGDLTLNLSSGHGGAIGDNTNNFLARAFGGPVIPVMFKGLGGNDVIYGTIGGDDWLDGGTGNDWMHGQAGNDVLIADSQLDTVIGGPGFDILIVDTPNGFSFTNITSLGNSEIEGFIGGAGNDSFIGGYATRFVLSGGGGNDTLQSHDLDDVIIGGAGNDVILAGQGVDLAILTGALKDYSLARTLTGFVLTDSHAGRDGSDTLEGVELLRFDDVTVAIAGTGGNDLLLGTQGNDTFSGGAGTDTVIAGLLPSQYVYAGGVLSGPEGLDTLQNVEKVRFGNSDLMLDQLVDPDGNGPASSPARALLESITDLYVAYFNRAADVPGLMYWFGNVSNSGWGLDDVASSFTQQVEYQQTYPPSLSNRDFVAAIYQNLFDRVPDQAGWDYWTNDLNNGSPRDVFILTVLNAVYSPTGSAGDKLIVDNKHDVALYYSEQLALHPSEPVDGRIDLVLNRVSADVSTVPDGKAVVDFLMNSPVTLTGLSSNVPQWEAFWS